MESRVFLLAALLSDIVGNGVFGGVLTNGADIVAVTPEFTAPQFFLYAGHTGKDFAGREALDSAHNFGGTVTGHGLYEKMHMIPIRTDFEKDDFVALCNIQAHHFQDLINFFTEDDSSVFGRTYDMV